MDSICPSLRAHKGHHEPYVEGTPHSSMTWYVCRLCGKREPRGEGAFYKRNPNPPKKVTNPHFPLELLS